MPFNQMPRVLTPVTWLNASLDRIRNISISRKKLGLDSFDQLILAYMIIECRAKLFIQQTAVQFADSYGLDTRMVQRSIKRLKDLDYIRRGQYKGQSFFIVDPLLVNSGDSKKRAFKIKLWQESIQSKKVIHHDIQKSHSS
jgi:hypothetical protein